MRDAEKAFDRVNALHAGFPSGFVDKIMLYIKHLQPEYGSTDLCCLWLQYKKNRQGWLLSPYLYILVMEHLANAIRRKSSIQGNTTGDYTHKMELFSDDLFIYCICVQPQESSSFRVQEFKEYGMLSKLNIQKTEQILLYEEPNAFPFKWKSDYIIYLGPTQVYLHETVAVGWKDCTF